MRYAIALLSCVAVATALSAQEAKVKVQADILFAEVDGHKLLLDLHLPEGAKEAPLIVWVHGGAWRAGSRKGHPLDFLVKQGYAVASVDYRLSPVAKFPAQIHDIKAAIRFLRAHAKEHGLSTARVGIAGASAGGHLVALVGVSNGHKELEGTVGKNLDQSSDVHAIVDYFGASNLTTILKQSTPHGLNVRVPALKLLLGDGPEEQPELAKLASPVFHVDARDPPLLLIHGDQDPQMPINQAHELHGEYKKHKLDVFFEVVHGGAHGGKGFHDDARNRLVSEFLERTLRKQ